MIAAGLESSGALEFVPELVLGRSKREWVGQVSRLREPLAMHGRRCIS